MRQLAGIVKGVNRIISILISNESREFPILFALLLVCILNDLIVPLREPIGSLQISNRRLQLLQLQLQELQPDVPQLQLAEVNLFSDCVRC